MDLTGITVYLYAKKADGTKVFNTVKVEDAKQGIVSTEITGQVLAIEGFVKLTLLLIKDNARLTSKIFTLKVDETIVDNETIESSNEFTALTDALGRVNNIDSRFENVNLQLASKANDNQVIKKGAGTLSDFDEETRRVLQGLDVGSINAVLGNENVKTSNIADKAVSYEKIEWINTTRLNLCNNTFEEGKLIYPTSGQLSNYSSTKVSDYIKVVDTNGLKWYYAGSNYTYNSVVYAGTVAGGRDDIWGLWVAIPEHIGARVGSNYQIIVTMSRYSWDRSQFADQVLDQISVFVTSKQSNRFYLEPFITGTRLNTGEQVFPNGFTISYMIVA